MDPMIGKWTMEDRKVSQYVIEVLGLTVGVQNCLMAVLKLRNSMDKVMTTTLAFKQIRGYAYVKNFKFCYDEADDCVCVLAHEDEVAKLHRAWKFRVGQSVFGSYQVKSIVVRKDSFEDFFDIPVRIKIISPKNSIVPDAAVPFTLSNEVVSAFIVENLNLAIGDQACLIAAYGLSNENKLMLVARAVRQNRGKEFLSIYKFALDSKSGVVYVLVVDEDDANLMAGRSFKVTGEIMSFYRVLKIIVRSAENDIYQTLQVNRIWPFAL